ncbi:SMI1/KNR4 family protein [Marinobacter koreensis]|uniref:SMI1/KNR4 family protein n=1 Tax=Marinobacter koreensis TaxID=335974 RepID=A0ABW0RL63_9GAMM|nr:SMI1/KNR4 family protein [Marinobacter koreensis]MCK7547905.1 SMI1/KNR4 family protein [Marinobacter koreensis]
MDWAKEIVVMVAVKQAIADLDDQGLWPHHFPEVAASNDDLQSLEASLGFELDKEFAVFLTKANGWKGFYQTVNLFGTSELAGGPEFRRAEKVLDSIQKDVLSQSGLARNSLLPIAASTADSDVFALCKPNSQFFGQIIWLAGAEIDRFSSFNEFYLSMVDYNRNEYQDLKNERTWM